MLFYKALQSLYGIFLFDLILVSAKLFLPVHYLQVSLQNSNNRHKGELIVTTSEATVERRSQSHRAIQKLVDHRTQMLSLYGELAAHRPYTGDGNFEYINNLVQRFCQALIDYTADAHFRLYRFVDNNKERRATVSNVAEKVYPYIEESTQLILDFNDKYDSDDKQKDLSSLERDLSLLGEKLADRIEQEDRLVDVLSFSRT